MFCAMLVLMALRVPIAAAMFVPGALGFMILSGEASLLNQLKGSAVARLTVYDLSVIPLFLLMGQFATQGGLSRRLFQAASAWVGHVRGGLGMASILSAGAFGAVCGSSVATSATITQVAYPEMKRHGYAGRLSTATLAAGGTLGILIPPSVPLVVYAILTEQNIAKLFAAAMVPGILAMLGYIGVVALLCRRNPELAPAGERVSWPARWRALAGVWPIALVFVIVFGGIYRGVFSPTEGAAVGAIATFVIALLQGELGLKGIQHSFLATAETSAMVFMIFLGADMMNATLALTAMPAALAELGEPPARTTTRHRGRGAGLLRAAGLRDGRAVDAAAHHPRALPGHHGPGPLGPGPARQSHLVRHPRAHDRRHRPHRPAGGLERLRRQQPRT